MTYNVLIVEDDPMVAMINEQYVRKNKNFNVSLCRLWSSTICFGKMRNPKS